MALCWGTFQQELQPAFHVQGDPQDPAQLELMRNAGQLLAQVFAELTASSVPV